ncbi:ABC transporter substrate-binding protein [Sneathiella sp.]|uniref:ABC transporter substrate-binding protein n=1 Tax=Sneathiella sp. TaxID=1964365 RepID=UPI00261EDC8D|nr:ABC transporter substrate-binding protein [Sneathiella sp.]MDF2368056.1 ABC transporter substrate-binding protein [Sneathiella sp.]
MTFRSCAQYALMAILLVLAACDDKNDTVNIGAIYNLTGGLSSLGIPSSEGAALAVDVLNDRGGILDREVNLVLVDGETNVEVIPQKTQDLIDKTTNMPVIIGMTGTDSALAAARVAAQNKRVFITSGATSPLLPSEVPEYLFLACYGDNVQAAAAAEWAISDLKVGTAAVLYKSDMTYTKLIRKYFEEDFQEKGGKIVFSQGYTADTLADVIAELPVADLIYFAASPDEVISGITAIRATGYEGPIASGDGFDIDENWDKLPTESNSFFTTHADVSADNTNPEMIAFRKAFADKYPDEEPSAFSALAYDAVMLVAAAAEKAGSLDVNAMRDALSTLQDYKGLTGTISYENGSRIPVKSVALFKVQDGKEVFVREFMPDNVPAP